MNILIAGASGFIGQNLVKALETNHKITVLGRKAALLEKLFGESIKKCTWDSLDSLDAKAYDVIINLCGHNIGASRWTPKIKKQLIESRVKTCRTLIDWAINKDAKPHFYCANAIGIYGLQENGDLKAFDENSVINFENPPDFLAEIAVLWQNAMQPALEKGMKVTITRFGVVLKKGEGILKKLSPSFYLGFGAVIGEGRQTLSWVHIDDVVCAYLFLLKHPELTGAFNLTAPNPVSQKQFAETLAKAMHRPLFLKIPEFVISKLFGEMGDSLLLKGQRVHPKRLIEEGYSFIYPDLSNALDHEFGYKP